MTSEIAIYQERKELLRPAVTDAAKRFITPINGKQYLQVAGLALIGASAGLMTRTKSCTRQNIDGVGWCWIAECEVLRDGTVVAGGLAMVADTEPRWGKADQFARMAMAQTRAQGRALRQCIGWAAALLAGVESTPFEEMPEAEHIAAPAAPAKRIKAEPVAPTAEAVDQLQLVAVNEKPGVTNGRAWVKYGMKLQDASGASEWKSSFDADVGAAAASMVGQMVYVILNAKGNVARIDLADPTSQLDHGKGASGGDTIPF